MAKRAGQNKAAVLWPTFARRPDAPLAEVVAALANSAYWPVAELLRGQRQQRARLAWWACTQAPFYRELGAQAHRLERSVDDAVEFENRWRELPLLRKVDLRTEAQRIYAARVPARHGPLYTTVTSGSTGTPVEVHGSALTRLMWNALTVREHQWQARDYLGRLGVVRYLDPPQRNDNGSGRSDWGSPVNQLAHSGPSSAIHTGASIDTIAAWLRRFDPHYLLVSPSVLDALLTTMDRPPRSLRQVRCMFEPLDSELELRTETMWSVDVTDTYSANEVGVIAFRCPEMDHLHVQDEAVHVEILDDNGAPSAIGEYGRVVITSLHNLATPLLRYELGDFARRGAPCACGRTSSTIDQVLGRVRNLATAPNGQKFWPVALNSIRRIQPVRQAQYVQTAIDAIELRVVLARALDATELAATRDEVTRALGYPYTVTVVPVAEIERGPTGKFEEFLSLI